MCCSPRPTSFVVARILHTIRVRRFLTVFSTSCLSTLHGAVGYGIPPLPKIHATYYSVIVFLSQLVTP